MGHGLCKNCYSKRLYDTDGKTKSRMEAYAKARPAMRAAIWRKHAYGLSEAEWYALYESQGGCCAICGKPEQINVLNIDHDHATGIVRGMLCGHCNKAIGLFGDDLDRIARAYYYLKEFLMPRKHDASAPQVLAFFKTAPIESVKLVLELARAEVATRSPKKAKEPKEPIRMPDPKGPPPATGAAGPQAPRQTRRQLRSATEESANRAAVGTAGDGSRPADVPLPGLQSTVGEG